MLNLSDKDLDRLSREAAGRYEIDENISSWEKLEQQLDKEIGSFPTTPAPRSGWMRMGYVSLILLFAVFSFFLFRGKKELELIQKRSSQIVTPAKSSGIASKTEDQKKIDQDLPNSPNQSDAEKDAMVKGESAKKPGQFIGQKTDSKNSQEPEASTIRANAAADGAVLKSPDSRSHAEPSDLAIPSKPSQKLIVRDPGKQGNLDLSKNKGFSLSRKAKNPLHPFSSDNILAKNKNHGNRQFDSKSSSLHPESQDQTVGENNIGQSPRPNAQSGEEQETRLEFSTIPQIEPLSNPGHLINDAALRHSGTRIQTVSPGSLAAAAKKSTLRIDRSLHIGILLAPDFTDVGAASNDKMSTNAGLTLGYHFFKNFSINTGIIFTRKNYAADGYDFHAPPNSWINGANFKLNSVQGSCNMIEIPLTLRYDYTTIGKTTFFVDGGLSSYLMKNESYTYFGNYLGWPSTTTKMYHNHTNYPFSTISLSVGVEQQIRKNLSIQIEPFVKIPLGGVGYGNLQLSSYGLALSVRYSPVLGRSRHQN